MDRLSTNSTIQQPEAIKVILADDNGDITSLLSDYLSGKPDIEVTGCASDGMELMNMLRERPCDILVMDLIMPALDGFAVLSMMDTLPVRPRTLVLSALGRGDFITRAMQLGADYYMMKPFGCEELYNRIQDMSRSAAPKSAIAAPAPVTPRSQVSTAICSKCSSSRPKRAAKEWAGSWWNISSANAA